MFRYKKSHTKIIATIGPACSNKEVLKKMFLEGVNVCRLNFSHGAHADHEKVIHTIKEINKEIGSTVAILADLQGPKLRIGVMEEGVVLEDGADFSFVSTECTGTAQKAYMSYEPLAGDVMPGEIILVDDGKIKLEVKETNRVDTVKTKVISGGPLTSRKGVNLPNTKISLPSLTEKDLKDAEFVLDFDIDWIALSFVRNAIDILDLKDMIKKKKKHTKIISKIEKPEALDDIDNIIDMSDGVMIARGDLGVETPFDKVPMLQKDLIRKSVMSGRPVIVATQMMESMITNFRPTRAEATDVANAVTDGADTVMLSGETSVGKYPIEVIRSMQQVLDATEGNPYVLKHDNKPDPRIPSYLPDAVSYNAVKMAELTGAKGIVVFSYTGKTVYEIAGHRPDCSLYAFTPTEQALTQLSLVRGVRSFYMEPEVSVNAAIAYATESLKSQGYVKQNDVLVFVGSIPMPDRGKTNMMKISMVD